MLSEGMRFVLNGANNPALRMVNRVFRKNGNEDYRFHSLSLALLAEMVVQHEGVKQGNYDASL